MNLLVLTIIGYLVGTIPTGFVLTKFMSGIDLRACGSHSTGATNVLRTCGKKQALFTLAIDASKGVIFSLLIKLLCDNQYGLVAVFACIVGHAFPIWLKFKGGKGVATSAGIFLTLSPLFACVSIFIWAFIAKVFKVSSVASMALGISFAVLTIYGYFVNSTSTKLGVMLFAISALIFLTITHIENIKRLVSGREEHV
ncbi:MAG: glycerol-3-phosphate 1-O-acyltransferase PlsY [Holosporales bacterium]|nr:glycerol-3-phosphate 1-O-acyltransferase PlsY [Holosporales bacterium]